MRILHITTESSWRGGEQQTAYLIDELNKKGVENYVVCRKDSAFEKYCREKVIDHVAFRMSGLSLFTAAFRLKEFLNSLQPELIHMHTSRAHVLMSVAYQFGVSVPGVVSRRVDFRPGNNRLTRWRYGLPLIRRIICVSDAIRTIMTDYLGEDSRCVTVYSGIDLNKFHITPSFSIHEELDIPLNASVIGNTSALADHKDYFTFVDTAVKIREVRNEICFVILGAGPLEHDIRNYIREKGMEAYFRMPGFKSNIQEWLMQFDVFLITSKTEGLGTSIVDAMAAGIPVVATRAGGIPELVIHERTGLLAGIRESRQLAGNVLRILDDPECAHSLISGASRHIQLFSKEVMGENTYKIYREITEIDGDR